MNYNWSHKALKKFRNQYSKKNLSYKFMFTIPFLNILKQKYGSALNTKKGIDYGAGTGKMIEEFNESGTQINGYDKFINHTYPINSIDYVISRFCFCSIDDDTLNDILSELYTQLHVGGIIIIGEDDWDNAMGKETIYEMWPNQELINGQQVKSFIKLKEEKIDNTFTYERVRLVVQYNVKTFRGGSTFPSDVREYVWWGKEYPLEVWSENQAEKVRAQLYFAYQDLGNQVFNQLTGTFLPTQSPRDKEPISTP